MKGDNMTMIKTNKTQIDLQLLKQLAAINPDMKVIELVKILNH